MKSTDPIIVSRLDEKQVLHGVPVQGPIAETRLGNSDSDGLAGAIQTLLLSRHKQIPSETISGSRPDDTLENINIHAASAAVVVRLIYNLNV